NMMFTSLQRIYPKERVAIHLPLSLGLHPDRLEVGVFSPDFDKKGSRCQMDIGYLFFVISRAVNLHL
ncbi:hypothetical protein, partial [Exiguobacterium oxidotolerans]|uniref:hypothetical protein n=1 Tax=Exiguobacterium oxidotolerans TaxID=223958 RepID=UPI001F378195